jgi:dihydrofolate reductase
VAERVREVKDQHDGDILVNGSAQLVRALADADLVDEYRLMVFPTVLGKGKRLVDDTAGTAGLKLSSTQQVGPDGVVILTYVPARD